MDSSPRFLSCLPQAQLCAPLLNAAAKPLRTLISRWKFPWQSSLGSDLVISCFCDSVGKKFPYVLFLCQRDKTFREHMLLLVVLSFFPTCACLHSCRDSPIWSAICPAISRVIPHPHIQQPYIHLLFNLLRIPSICPSIHSSIHTSTYLSLYSLTHPSVYLPVYPPTHLLTYSPTDHPLIYLFTHPPFICPSNPSTHPSILHLFSQSFTHTINHSLLTHPSIHNSFSTYSSIHLPSVHIYSSAHWPPIYYLPIYLLYNIYIMLYISIIYTHPFIYGGGVTTIHPSTHAPIIYPPIAKYTHSPIYPSTQPSIYSSMHYSFIHLLIHLSIYSSTHLAMCSYINPLIYPSPICPSDHLSTSTLPSIYSADPSLHLLVDSSILPSFICLHPPSTHPYPSSLHIASQNTSFWALANCVPDPRGNSTSLVVLDTETQAVRGHNFLREESREGGGWGMSLGSVFL